MKNISNRAQPFDEWLLHELYFAYLDARKKKRSTEDEFRFEAELMPNLIGLRDSIVDGLYKPSRGVAFIIHDPVIREIFAAPFRDRVIHHFLYDQCADWWDRRFIYDSYSCRLNKGTLFGVNRLRHHIGKVSKGYSIKTYVIKLDIQGYFMSLDREMLYERVLWGLERQPLSPAIHDLLEYLWKEIIFDDPIADVHRRGSIRDWEKLPRNKSLFNQPEGQGIVIGNLTSQLLSNIYLDQLDRFVTMELGYRHYGRYVDDFYIIVTEDEFSQALNDIPVIEDFLSAHLGLTLHPRKRYIQDVRHGVEFLGKVIYPSHTTTSKRFKKNFYKAAYETSIGLRDANSIASYIGYLSHVNGKKLAYDVFERYGWDYKF